MPLILFTTPFHFLPCNLNLNFIQLTLTLVIQLKQRTTILQSILPSVLKELNNVGKGDIFTKFMELVHAKKNPLNNIAFSLFCVVVSWYSLSDTSCMTYSEETMQFLWVDLKLFGGRFVRFMTGLKNDPH